MGKARNLANIIADGAIGTSEIADSAVTDAKIAGLNASKLSGDVATARLGTGTADSTTFLRGDSTWQTISTTPTTAQVLTATAGASAGAVGTYTVIRNLNSGTVGIGGTTAGSNLRGLDSASNIIDPGFSGTWRNMGCGWAWTANNQTLFLRIS